MSPFVLQAWRSWKGAKATALLVVLAFTVGIGSATAIYAVIHSLLLKPLPYAHGERFVSMLGRVARRSQIDVVAQPEGRAGVPAANSQLRCFRSDAVHQFQPDRPGTAAVPERSPRHTRIGQQPGSQPEDRAVVQRCSGRTTRSNLQRTVAAPGLRPWHRGQGHHPQRSHLHRHRSHAPGIQSAVSRRLQRSPDRRLGASRPLRRRAGSRRPQLLLRPPAARGHGCPGGCGSETHRQGDREPGARLAINITRSA